MKKIAGIIIVLTAIACPFAASAGAAEVNFGQCQSQLDPSVKYYQAPGQSENGPLTIVDGDFHVPSGFDGAVGCYK